MTSDSIQPYENINALHRAAADAFCELAKATVDASGRFAVSLSGGSTPRGLYEMLSQRELPWNQIHWFWGDERNVPEDHSDSNFRMVCEALLNRVSIPQTNIHGLSIQQSDPVATAEAYERELRKFFADDSYPSWDLALLGMGDDAHTASLFPATKAVDETKRWFIENWVDKFDTHRYTLTAPAINSARHIWFLVSGNTKQSALASVWGSQRDPQQFPAQLIQPTRWFVTADALPVA